MRELILVAGLLKCGLQIDLVSPHSVLQIVRISHMVCSSTVESQRVSRETSLARYTLTAKA
jgi:hypothetical protein